MDTKMRILAIERMLNSRPMTANQIIKRLELEYNINADRKAIYDDIAVLTYFMPNLNNIRCEGYFLSEGG